MISNLIMNSYTLSDAQASAQAYDTCSSNNTLFSQLLSLCFLQRLCPRNTATSLRRLGGWMASSRANTNVS